MLPAATQADFKLKAALTEADVKDLATQLNAHIDVPFIPEVAEQVWIEFILGKAVGVVPAELVIFLIDASDGLTEDEVRHYEDLITTTVNTIIDIPLVSENMEESLIRPVVHQLVQYALSGVSLRI
jgi:hypothetical protein